MLTIDKLGDYVSRDFVEHDYVVLCIHYYISGL